MGASRAWGCLSALPCLGGHGGRGPALEAKRGPCSLQLEGWAPLSLGGGKFGVPVAVVKGKVCQVQVTNPIT